MAALPAPGHRANTCQGTMPTSGYSCSGSICAVCAILCHLISKAQAKPLCRHKEEAGSWSAGRWAQPVLPSFLPSPHLPPFSKMLPAEPQHLPKHLSPCCRDDFVYNQQTSTSITQCCSSSPSFIGTQRCLVLVNGNPLIYQFLLTATESSRGESPGSKREMCFHCCGFDFAWAIQKSCPYPERTVQPLPGQ